MLTCISLVAICFYHEQQTSETSMIIELILSKSSQRLKEHFFPIELFNIQSIYQSRISHLAFIIVDNAPHNLGHLRPDQH